MAIATILDVTEQSQPTPQGALERVLRYQFRLDAVSGAFTVEVGEDEANRETVENRISTRAGQVLGRPDEPVAVVFPGEEPPESDPADVEE
jgi:hypothetical protein